MSRQGRPLYALMDLSPYFVLYVKRLFAWWNCSTWNSFGCVMSSLVVLTCRRYSF